MFEIRQSDAFATWLDGLRDRRAQAKVAIRLVRVSAGLLGDSKSLGDGVSELRIDYGPGYRLYYTLRGNTVVILLCGSDKRDQTKAIKLAKQLAQGV